MPLKQSVREKEPIDLYRGISEFKKGYQPGNNLVNYENSNLFADSQNMLIC